MKAIQTTRSRFRHQALQAYPRNRVAPTSPAQPKFIRSVLSLIDITLTYNNTKPMVPKRDNPYDTGIILDLGITLDLWQLEILWRKSAPLFKDPVVPLEKITR